MRAHWPKSNQEFLQGLLGSEWESAHVCGFPEDPGTLDKTGKRHFWAGGRARDLLARLQDSWNNYVVISLFELDEHGRVRRSKHLHRWTWAIVVDDVGTGGSAKVNPARLAGLTPTARVETSRGNEQWWFVLELPEDDRARVDALLNGMVASGLCPDGKDPGMKGVTRYVRLPFGRNTKAKYGPGGWTVQLVEWRPEVRVTLEELAAAFMVDVDPDRVPRERSSVSALGPDGVDPWLEGLRTLGLVRGEIRAGVWDVVCPWVHEHTDRADTGTAYFAGTGALKCHHGHCQDKRAPEFQARVRELLDQQAGSGGGPGSGSVAVLAGASFGVMDLDTDHEIVRRWNNRLGHETPRAGSGSGGGGSGSGGGVQRFLRDIVYVARADRFWDERDRCLLSRAALNTVWTRELAGVLNRRQRPDGWFSENPATLVVSDLVYWPGRGMLLDDASGRRCLNTWRPSAAVLGLGSGSGSGSGRVRVRLRDIRPWLDLVGDVFDGDRRMIGWFLAWSALVVWRPEVKPGWGWVLMGGQGIGKDLVTRPLRAGVGSGNWEQLDPDKLVARFNSWLEKKLVLVPELKQTTRGSVSGHDQYNRIKQYLGSVPEFLAIERKGLDVYQVPNLGAWIFTSNEDVPLPIAADDRRLAVVSSRAKPRADDWYGLLVDWLDAGGERLVLGYLRGLLDRLPLSVVHGLRGRAPRSSAKDRLIRASVDPVEEFLRDRIEDNDWPDLLSGDEILSKIGLAIKAGTQGLGVNTHPPSARKITSILRRLGAVQVHHGEKISLPDGSRRRLWALRDGERYLEMAPDDAARAYISGQIWAGDNVVPFRSAVNGT